MKHTIPNCATCPFVITERLCRKEDGRSPDSCSTKNRTELKKQNLIFCSGYVWAMIRSTVNSYK